MWPQFLKQANMVCVPILIQSGEQRSLWVPELEGLFYLLILTLLDETLNFIY
jgi:hypothetical protein